MEKRFVSIWFPHLSTDWFALSQPQLKQIPFVLRTPSHGRMMITAANAQAVQRGINIGTVLADARAVTHDLQVMDDKPDLIEKLLLRLADWCIRFTPMVSIDPPDGLLFDATGCSHLWGGDQPYLDEIMKRLRSRGYDVHAAIADTIGVAWGVARFEKDLHVITSATHMNALISLPPEALRLEVDVILRLHKLGLHRIRQFISMPRSSLRRRFGQHFMMRLDMAIGQEMEMITSVIPVEPFLERLPCLEPIVTATGIEMALTQLLETLCLRLQQKQQGLRTCIFKGYRVDGKIEQVNIGTSRPSHHVRHLFKLFQNKLSSIEPALGIELFTLEASRFEDCIPQQEKMWESSCGLEDVQLTELIDRLANKFGSRTIHRYLPDEHYWPERSYKLASSINDKVEANAWPDNKVRPLQLLSAPEHIEVTAPIPDYPPMLFRYKDKVHNIAHADGPERIEQEWWLQQGQHRDYYRVEDEQGLRYWIFRLGHYHDKAFQWFIHGFFP